MARYDYKAISQAADMRDVLAACGIAVENNKALCPFHADRHPSMQVYRDGYHCFVCGAHGDAIDLIQHVKRCTRKEAAQIVAGIAGCTIEVATDYDLVQRRIQRELAELEYDLDVDRLHDIDSELEALDDLCYTVSPWSAIWCAAWQKRNALEAERVGIDERVMLKDFERWRIKHGYISTSR